MQRVDTIKDIVLYLHFYCIVFALHCICMVLYCIALYCIVLHCIILYCIALYCIVLYCIVLYCIVWYITPSHPPSFPQGTKMLL